MAIPLSPTTYEPQALASRELHTAEPLVGVVFSVILVLASITVISGFLTQRIIGTKTWRGLPFIVWLVYLIYVDSYLFVFVTAILQFALGVNTNINICDGAILLCLVCYVTTKVLIYLFLVERAHVVRGVTKSRLKSKLYLFNSFGMLGAYTVIAILNFIFRITRLENNLCVIGMQKISMIPLISFDAVVNIYLTLLFLIPLKNLYSFKNFPKTQANIHLRTLALRTFIGAVCTTISSIVNLTVLMVLNGEPGWICLMCCNSDILFSAAVVQWVTSKDHVGSLSTRNTSDPTHRGTDISFPYDRALDRHRHSRGKPNANGGRSFDAVDYTTSGMRSASAPASEYGDSTVEHGIRRTSSQKRVLDDMGDIAVDGSVPSSTNRTAQEAAYKASSGATSSSPSSVQLKPHNLRTDKTGTLQATPSSRVVITTTIGRDSRSGSGVYRDAGLGEADRRPVGQNASGERNCLAYATTEITGVKKAHR